MKKGSHLLVDCTGVDRSVCLDDGRFLEAMAEGCRRAGAAVISQVRYRFGHESPPGFAAVVLVDESHCSAHSYADLGLVAIDIFTCGDADPYVVLDYMRSEIPLGDVSTREIDRFVVADAAATAACRQAVVPD